MSSFDHYLIQPLALIRIYKLFKSEPNKIFLQRDFGTNYRYKIHLQLLIKLGLIEEVCAVYRLGSKYKAVRSVKGYRLKKI